MARQPMFRAAAMPQVGGMVRSGMGTRLAVVLYAMPHPQGQPGWLCHVLPLGSVVQGVWHGPGNTQCGGYGHRAGRWLHVWPNSHSGWHPVVAGPGMPAVPLLAAHYLQEVAA